MIRCVDAPPEAALPGHCGMCGVVLTGRRTAWCSKECDDRWYPEHWWTTARRIAMERTNGRCVRCGAPAAEVDHIEPRQGQGYQAGCWNHQSNLQPLCQPCHIAKGIVWRAMQKALQRSRVLALAPGPIREPEAMPISLWDAA